MLILQKRRKKNSLESFHVLARYRQFAIALTLSLSHTHTHTHSQIHTHTHTHIHTHSYTYTHTHTRETLPSFLESCKIIKGQMKPPVKSVISFSNSDFIASYAFFCVRTFFWPEGLDVCDWDEENSHTCLPVWHASLPTTYARSIK